MKRTSERIIKLHLLVQFVLNFSNNSVSSLFFRAFRIFCPKAVKSSIGIIVHLKNIVSFRFAQRDNLIMPDERYDYADFINLRLVINLYCSRQRTIMYSVEVQNGLYDTKRGRRKMGCDTS